MMITAHKKNHVTRIPLLTKRAIAFEALKNKQTIVSISRQYDCSRNTVYEQQKIALAGANKAFESANQDVLFYLPVTKNYIHSVSSSFFLSGFFTLRDFCKSFNAAVAADAT